VTTIPAGIRGFIAYTTARYDLLMAAGTIVTIPVLIMFFTMQKKFISGMTAGAVKVNPLFDGQIERYIN